MNEHDIAIVGMACVFPGAVDVRQFWHNIVNGVDAVSEIPPGRWHYGYKHRQGADREAFIACSRGGFLPSDLRIDLARFGVFPNLIGEGDADQFLTLHVVDAALADAGVAADAGVRRRTDLVIGRGGHCTNRQLEVAMNTEVIPWVHDLLAARFPELGRQKIDAIHRELRRSLPSDTPDNISTAIPNLTASRAANRLDLRGAAYVVDAACASSLIAVEQLVHRLRLGLCDLGVAGGISLNQNAGFWSIFTQLNAISATGDIRPFDRRANGTVLAEGAGAVVLKRLTDAARDGDQIYAVIKGVGSSSDGREAGLLAPTTAGQVESLRAAYRDAALDPATIGYLEAHGTATGMGDAAEIATIKTIFGIDRSGPLARPMGSIKSMIGHALPAAGIASLIRTVLALSNKIIPPSLHCDEPHPDLAGAPFYVNPATRSWIHSLKRHPRRAGVNAFGFGGINCHVILEEVPETNSAKVGVPRPRPIVINLKRDTELVLFSGQSRGEILLGLAKLRRFLDCDKSDHRLQDIAYTSAEEADLNQPCKLALVAKSTAQLSELIDLCAQRLGASQDLPADQVEDRETIYYSDSALAQHGRLALTFPPIGFPPGLYGNYPDRLLHLCLHFPDVRSQYDSVDLRDEHPDDPITTSALLVPPPTVSLAEKRELRSRFGVAKLKAEGEETPSQIPNKRNLSALGVTLSNWASWVLLRPLEIPVDMLCGQSQGDMAALCVAGAADFHHFVDNYWATMDVPQSYTAQGHLALASVSEERIAPFLAEIPDVAIAIHASRSHMILGGSTAGLRELSARLRKEGVEIQNFAYPPIHTPRLTYMREHLRDNAGNLKLVSPKIPVYCSTSAELFSDDPDGIRASLMDNLDRPILWWQTYRKMYEDGARIFLQAGGTVTNNIDRLIVANDRLSLSIDSSDRDPLTQLNHVCAALFTAGCRFRPAPIHRDRDVRRLTFGEPQERALASPTAMPMRLDPPWLEVPKELSVPELVPPEGVLAPAGADQRPAGFSATTVSGLAPSELPGQPDCYPAPAGERVLPLMGNVLHFVPGEEIVAERCLTLDEDRYLADHHFINAAEHKPLRECLPIMPMAMAIETMAEVASQLVPGLQFIGFEDVRALRWIALEDTDTLPVRAQGRLLWVDPASGVHAVEVALFAPGHATPNTSGTVLFAPERRQDIALEFSQIEQSESWWFSPEEIYGEHLMFHGPTFHCITGLGELAATGCTAEFTIPSNAGLFASTSLPLLLTNPCIMDAISQMGGTWTLARFADIYILPTGVEKVEYYRDSPAPGTRVPVRLEVTHFDVENKELRVDVEVGDGEGYVWMRCRGFMYRSFNMINRVIAVRRRPERYCASIERAFRGQSAESVCLTVARDFLRDIPMDWIARIYLHSDEMSEYRELAPFLARQREWLMGRLAAKDVVRTWVFRRDPSAGQLIHPSTIVIRPDALGRPVVVRIAGSDSLPEISISHCSRAAMAVAGEVPVGVDIALVSPAALEVWEQFTTATEAELFADRLQTEPDEEWATRLWCAKEAVGKALGTGLAGRPRDFQATDFDANGRIQICHLPTGELFSVSTERDDALVMALTERGPAAPFGTETSDFELYRAGERRGTA
jgi:acyl transferase domain-containing protein/phosphopantetheinyl transferase